MGGPGVRSILANPRPYIKANRSIQVLLSYIQQSYLLLTMWAFLSLMRFAGFLATCRLMKHGLDQQGQRSNRWRWAVHFVTRLTRRWKFPRATTATKSALSVFYATQVFFLITLQAA